MDCSMPGFLSFTSPGVCSNSCPLRWWCYLTISSSAVSFSFSLQSFSASRSFPGSQHFASGGQSIGASDSISPSSDYAGLISFRIDWFDLLADQGTQESSPAHLAPSLGAQLKLSSAHFSCILVNRCSLGPLLFASSWMRWLLCGSSGYQLCLCDHWKSTGVLKIWWIRPAPPTGLHVPVI